MTLDPMLSRFIGALGLLLPFALYLAAGRQESLSAYYHTQAQSMYLVILLSVAGALAAFGVWDRGMPQAVRVVAASAALALAVTALVPTSSRLEAVHGLAALLFFGMASWLTAQWGPEPEYRLLAGIIASSVVMAGALALIRQPIYWAEVAGVVAFSLGWLRRVL